MRYLVGLTVAVLALLPATSRAAPALVAPPVIVPAPPSSASPAPPPAPSPEAMTAARELLRVSDIRGQMRAIGPQMAQASERQMQEMFGANAIPEGLRAQFAEATGAFMSSLGDAFTPPVQERMAIAYARHFSVAELTRIAALMRDPAMVAFRERTPQVTADLLPVMYDALTPQRDAFLARIKAIVRDWIAKHPGDKAKMRSPGAT